MFRLPAIGRRAAWEFTSACSFGCFYCQASATPRPSSAELSPERALSLADELAAAGFVSVKLTGGEPLSRSDVFAVIERLRNRGIGVDLSTNGSLVNDESAGRLAWLDLDYVHVGFDGFERATFEEMRGRGSFVPALRGLRALVSAGVPTRVGCVVARVNEGPGIIEGVARLCAEEGVGSAVFSRMTPSGRCAGDRSGVAISSDDELADRVESAAAAFPSVSISHSFRASSGASSPCQAGRRLLRIASDGRVSPCPWIDALLSDGFFPGSLAVSSLDEILSGSGTSGFVELLESLGSEFGCPAELSSLSVCRAISDLRRFPEPSVGPFGKHSSRSRIYARTTERVEEGLAAIVRSGDRVLSVCGAGDQAIAALRAGAASVTCVDPNEMQVAWARLRLRALGVLSRSDFAEGLDAASRSEAIPFSWSVLADDPSDAALLSHLRAFPEVFRRLRGDGASRALLLPWTESDEDYAGTRALVANSPPTFAAGDVASAASAGFDVVWLSNLADSPHPDDPADPLCRERLRSFSERILRPSLNGVSEGGRVGIYVYGGGEESPRSAIDVPALRSAPENFLSASLTSVSIPTALAGVSSEVGDELLVIARPDEVGLGSRSRCYGASRDVYSEFREAEDADGVVVRWISEACSSAGVDASALDAGCGDGILTSVLSGFGLRCLGIDVSPEQISAARARGLPGASFRVGDLTSGVEVEVGRHDLIVAAWVLGTIRNEAKRELALRSLLDGLRPGGRLLLVENASGGAFEEIRGRDPGPSGETALYARWLLDRGLISAATATTRFSFPDASSARRVFGAIWGSAAAAATKVRDPEHRIELFEARRHGGLAVDRSFHDLVSGMKDDGEL
jgi:MoaA/NifB/PqqE/SkfB family radical SAM enzyme/SAM-dependent methyltransferase